MFRCLIVGTALGLGLTGAALAETYEVQMLNRGEAGAMVFEPGALVIEPGDTVRFLATDRGHNAETIEGMLPEGAEAFVGAINEEIEVTFDEAGFYGVMCKPHFAMGMVMTIQVGAETVMQEDFLEGRLPPRVRERLDAQIAELPELAAAE